MSATPMSSLSEKRRAPRPTHPQPPASTFVSTTQQSRKKSPPTKPFAPRIVNGPRGPLSRPNAFCSVPFPLKNTCICDRPKAHVICKRCGYECEGRVQLVCDVHPTTLSLMDLRECANPICRSIQIFESAFSSLNDRTTTTDSTENANSSADQQQQ
ncbi:hypothetical protein Q1695_014600 [Nippostrongylus brasiliensis]|nr:hypothetical protein Q1695_014600 [Nippostrongylus brasiliensis]